MFFEDIDGEIWQNDIYKAGDKEIYQAGSYWVNAKRHYVEGKSQRLRGADERNA